MTDIDRLIGFMAIMQVPFMNDPDALAYIEEVKTVLKQVKAQKPGWISVKDRLPEKNTPVLWYVVIKGRGMGHCRLGTFDGAVNHEVPSVSCCGPNAIPKFWMPLPEPPKEDRE